MALKLLSLKRSMNSQREEWHCLKELLSLMIFWKLWTI